MKLSVTKNNTINIFDIACGQSHALIPLIYFYKDYKINYIGVDNDKETIELNQNCFKNIENVRFILGDAADPKQLVKLGIKPGFSDLTLLRNSNFTDAFEVFNKMVQETIPVFLKPGGKLYMSFYEKDARIFMEKIYKPEKYNMLEDSCQVEHPPEFQTKQGIIKPDQFTFWGGLTEQFTKEKENARSILEKEFNEHFSEKLVSTIDFSPKV